MRGANRVIFLHESHLWKITTRSLFALAVNGRSFEWSDSNKLSSLPAFRGESRPSEESRRSGINWYRLGAN